jgi:hypothetical protein
LVLENADIEAYCMEPAIITSFSLGLIFGGVVTAAFSINELKRLREILSAKNFADHDEVLEKVEQQEVGSGLPF